MIEDQLYREALIDIFENPKNRGTLESPNFEASQSNPNCGDEVRIQLKTKGEEIKRAMFSGDGCLLSQVSASVLTAHLENKTLRQARAVSSDDILGLVGIKPGPARLKCVFLSLEVLKEAISDGSESKS